VIKSFLKGLGIFSLVLLAGLIFSGVKGLIWPEKDIINVTSHTEEGVKFSDDYKVKFLPDRVIGTFWTDFYISGKGKYVFDFSEDVANEKISYRLLEDKFVESYQLQKKYSWWQSHGLLIILGIGLVFSFFGEDFWRLIFAIAGDADG